MNAIECFINHLNGLIDSGKIKKSDFPKEVGISRSSLDGWLRRENVPNLNQVQRIADWAGFKVADLFKEETLPDAKPRPKAIDALRLEAIQLILAADADDIGTVIIGLKRNHGAIDSGSTA